MEIIIILLGTSSLGLGGISAFLYKKLSDEKVVHEKALSESKNIPEEKQLELVGTKAKEILLDAEKKALEIQSIAEKKIQSTKDELIALERKLTTREETIEKRAVLLDEKESKVESKNQSLEQAKRDVQKIRTELSTKLESLAQLSKEEAKALLMNQMTEDLKDEMAKKIKEHTNELKSTCDDITKEILVEAMEKSAVDYVQESTVTIFSIPNEDVKGRIIGKEGRNIRTFEKLTGVDVIIDESPDAITLSCFDPLRRHVASLALEKLIQDGRIHPGKIEETIQKVKEQIAKEIKKNGEKLAMDAGITNIDPGLIKLLGRFKYRTSYGQGLDKHTMEVVNICGHIAAEIGINVQLAKKCALFHDVGKIVSHEMEGGHPELGVQIGEKFHLEEEVKNAMLAHHELAEPICLESALVHVGDAISAARPGARFNNLEDYVKRIKSLEDTARKYEGVKEVYAIHAGREVRVIVVPNVISDSKITLLAHDIAKKIEDTQTYAGTVKVTVVRETRGEGMAK